MPSGARPTHLSDDCEIPRGLTIRPAEPDHLVGYGPVHSIIFEMSSNSVPASTCSISGDSPSAICCIERGVYLPAAPYLVTMQESNLTLFTQGSLSMDSHSWWSENTARKQHGKSKVKRVSCKNDGRKTDGPKMEERRKEDREGGREEGRNRARETGRQTQATSTLRILPPTSFPS